MNILKEAESIVRLVGALSNFNPKLVIASTGSCYVYLANCKVKCIRVANHTGHKEQKCTWQLRSDVSSSRKGRCRIYTNTARLISDLV